jgi:hypothetical protein
MAFSVRLFIERSTEYTIFSISHGAVYVEGSFDVSDADRSVTHDVTVSLGSNSAVRLLFCETGERPNGFIVTC